VREADNLPPYSADVKKSRSLNPSGPAWPVMGVLYLYLLYIYNSALLYDINWILVTKTAFKVKDVAEKLLQEHRY
jgi:hypothetical protein